MSKSDDLISRQDAVNEIHKYFWEEIEKTPTEIDEDGDELYADMPTVDSLLACNKELSKRIKSLPSAEPKTKCIAQIKIDRDDIEDLVNEKVNEIACKMLDPKTNMKSWDGLYIKVYADDDPQDKAEKMYQICGDIAELSEVAEFLKEYCDIPSEEMEEYELATEQMEHDAMYEPTYNSEDGSM